ncbi:MAG: Ig-like domain repeat protein, partial [Rhizobiales bacterium]|nr:Ig-like domain repeat protein [Hyphomicrobiales bacterium]
MGKHFSVKQGLRGFRCCNWALAVLPRLFDYRLIALVVAGLSLTSTDAVALLGSTTSVASSASPSAVGQSVTFTATVSGLVITPTGTATFMDGVTQIGTAFLDGSGHATITTSALSAGNHVVTVLYGGDLLYNPSSSPPFAQIVTQDSSTTTLVSSLNNSGLTQPVTFTATVSCGATPSGSVNFLEGPTLPGTVPLDGSGQATFTTSLLLPGSRSISAVYGGDTNCASSTAPPVTQVVNLLPTTTSVLSSNNPGALGQSITFTATVGGLIVTPTGSVTFMDGTTVLGTASLNGSGQAILNTNALATGSHSITATYGGDLVYAGSSSPALMETINQNSSTISVASSLNPSGLTQAVTFTATVTSTGGIPSGIVSFREGSTELGTGTIDGTGRAVFTTSLLLAGNHSITAVYGGDGSFSASTSSVLVQVVNLLASATTLSSSGSPSAV